MYSSSYADIRHGITEIDEIVQKIKIFSWGNF